MHVAELGHNDRNCGAAPNCRGSRTALNDAIALPLEELGGGFCEENESHDAAAQRQAFELARHAPSEPPAALTRSDDY